MSRLPSNATLEERERYAYIAGDVQSAALHAYVDELKGDSDHMHNNIIQLEEYITKLQERHLD